MFPRDKLLSSISILRFCMEPELTSWLAVLPFLCCFLSRIEMSLCPSAGFYTNSIFPLVCLLGLIRLPPCDRLEDF